MSTNLQTNLPQITAVITSQQIQQSVSQIFYYVCTIGVPVHIHLTQKVLIKDTYNQTIFIQK